MTNEVIERATRVLESVVFNTPYDSVPYVSFDDSNEVYTQGIDAEYDAYLALRDLLSPFGHASAAPTPAPEPIGVQFSKETGGAYADVREVIVSELARIRNETTGNTAAPDAPAPQSEAEHQAALIRRDGFMCERHPGLEFEHDTECAGPGMPWVIEGREEIAAYTERVRTAIVQRLREDALCQANCGHTHKASYISHVANLIETMPLDKEGK